MSEGGFWDDQAQANKRMQELKGLKNIVDPYYDCVKRVQEAKELLELSAEDAGMMEQIDTETRALAHIIETIQSRAML